MSLVGKTISHYEIIEQIGSGGMGIVYRARDKVLDRELALKFLPPELSRDADANLRFMREAKAASALEHPNICTIYEVGQSDDGQLFIAMPFYRGQTLKYVLADHRPSTEEAFSIAHQVAEGLSAAHDQGIHHRDIKPDNIMVTDRDRAVVLDFGLATLPGALKLTRAGSTVGTAAYMSPEQLQGEEVGSTSDLWSLGVVLYQMLAGRLPFEGDYEQALTYSILNRDVEPVDGVDDATNALLAGLLEKNPAKRIKSARALVEEIETIRATRAISTSATEGARSAASRKTVVWAGLAVIAVVVGLFALWPRSETVMPVDEHAISVLPFAVRGDPSLAYLGEGLVDLLSLSVDGAGDIRAIDPNAIIGRIEKDGLEFRTPEDASRLAGELGASYAVLGRVNSIGTVIQLSATVYDVSGRSILDAKAEADSEDRLQAAVDDIARQIVSAVLGLEADEIAIQGVRATESIDALKAYLAGEQHIRRGRFREAAAILEEAVAADSLFALAWSRMGFAYGWGISVERENVAMQKALDLNDRLPQRARVVTEARYLGLFQGEFERAADMLKALLIDNPNDLMALQLAGEILYHTNTIIGEPASDAFEYFQRATQLAPDHGDNLIHLHDTALELGDDALADSIADAFLSLDTTRSELSNQLRILKMVQHTGGLPEDDAARQELFNLFDGLGVVAAWNSSNTIATELEDFETYRTLLQRVADRRDASELVQDFYGMAISFVDMATGHYARFLDYDLSHPDTHTASRLLEQAVVATTAGYPVTTEYLEDLQTRIAEWDTTAFPSTYWIFELVKGDAEAARQYLLALVALRLGEAEDLERARRELDEMATTRDGHDAAFIWLRSVDAAMALDRGDHEAALAALDESIFRAEWRENRTPIKGMPNNIVIKAEAFAREGRLEEALRTFRSIRSADNRIGLPLYGLVYYRSGQLHEELGQIDEAMDMYARLMRLWGDADPQYQPLVEEASSSLDRLAILKAREPA